MAWLDELLKLGETATDGKTPPSKKLVDWFHQKVSTTKKTDIHHTIGFGPGQVSQGDHDHDGVNSKGLWEAADIPANLPASPTNAQIATTVNAMLELMREKQAD